MNIFIKIKNNFEYAYHRKRVKHALIKTIQHVNDEREWKKWASITLYHERKCCEIMLK